MAIRKKPKKLKTPEQIQDAIEALSPRARQVFDRMQSGGFWQCEHDPDLPKCTAELMASGLVVRIVRAEVMRACLAPIGSKSMKQDVIKDHRLGHG